MRSQPNVIIPADLSPLPEEHELEAAWILARHFKSDVEFLLPVDDYKRKTPDVKINGRLWEIKNLNGHSRTTVGNQVRRASKQSKYIVIDSRHTRLSDSVVTASILRELKWRPSIKVVLLINKPGNVIELIRPK